MIGIIGGGFGLYAWMPSLAQYYPKENIAIEKRHKEKFDKRPELQQYKNRIYWVDSIDRESYIINNVELLILAIPPNQTFNYLNRILNSPYSLKKIIVEKPICETPEKSEEFIKQIEAKGIKICSSYLFFYTDWFKELNPNNQYSITWIKSNDNFKDSWKHKEELGGGQMFYNIHLLALKSYLKNIETNFIHMFSPDYNILNIKNKTTNSEISTTPFSDIIHGEDNRVSCLKQLLHDFENNYEKVNKIMKDTNKLWMDIEEKQKPQ